MFDSQVKANDFISALKSETDIAPDIPDSYFIDWINGVEQTLYDNVIREERVVYSTYTTLETDMTEVTILLPDDDTDVQPTRFEDVVSFIADNRALTKVDVSVGVKHLFPFTFWKTESGFDEVVYPAIKAYVKGTGGVNVDYILTYTIRPILKNIDNIDTETVKVPAEFLDMVRAKIRGEAYKFANEDALAAKWLNDYNQQIEYFRAWIASKSPTFGA